jgi:serine O-acetyltransferase
MNETSLFDSSYESRKGPLLKQVVARLLSIYTEEEADALRIDPISRGILSQPSGRGFVNRDILETVLGNLLECVAPGSHNALETIKGSGLEAEIEEIADQLYAMIVQSFLAAEGNGPDIETFALDSTFSLLSEIPRLKERSLWNRFASLKDPAVWDAYITTRHDQCVDALSRLDHVSVIDMAIEEREFGPYREFLKSNGLDFAFDYLLQLVVSTYPGWRVLFYHDIAHALTRTGSPEDIPELNRVPVPLLPRAISELGGRYYQADLHPETTIGDANFLDHPHRGLTTGQTGEIGVGCYIYPCTLGGLSGKVRLRHPAIGNYVQIGTDATLLGPVRIGDHTTIGPNTQIYGFVKTGKECRIASSVVIGTVLSGTNKPGNVLVGDGVRVGDGTVIENSTELDLTIPEKAEIPARSHVVNDGFGNPRFVRE